MVQSLPNSSRATIYLNIISDLLALTSYYLVLRIIRGSRGSIGCSVEHRETRADGARKQQPLR